MLLLFVCLNNDVEKVTSFLRNVLIKDLICLVLGNTILLFLFFVITFFFKITG